MDSQAFEAGTTGKATPADTGSLRSRHRTVRDVLIAGGLAIGLIAVILALGCFRYGDIPSFVAAIRGDDLFVGVQELPERADGTSRQLTFNVRIKNLTMRSFRVLGINDTCDCISVEGIPTTVGARESKDVLIKLRVSAGQSPITAVALITDDAQLNQIVVTLMQPRSPD
jgi:hypothetical protein